MRRRIPAAVAALLAAGLSAGHPPQPARPSAGLRLRIVGVGRMAQVTMVCWN